METILAPIDFSDISARVVNLAGRLAQALSARVILLHVLPTLPAVPSYALPPEAVKDEEVLERRRAFKRLMRYQRKLSGQGIETGVVSIKGPAAPSILAQAAESGAAYLVIGSHGHGAIYTLLLGSTAAELVRKAPCPVVLVPRQEA